MKQVITQVTITSMVPDGEEVTDERLEKYDEDVRKFLEEEIDDTAIAVVSSHLIDIEGER